MADVTIERDVATLRITGTEVHYYVLCPRKLWWFCHGMEQEHSGGGTSGQENVALGSLLHETSYPGKTRKDVMIDDLLRLDFTDEGKVHEVKKSRGADSGKAYKASLCQLLYYLYYLKHVKGVETSGVLDFPAERRREEVTLTPERENEVAAVLDGVVKVRALSTPPEVVKPMSLCKKCAYEELCWG
jgi:CRISPR-associated exonuclease Cas4